MQQLELIFVIGNFSQWGYLKTEVYKTNPQIEELR
jgi:hypothetical protein